MDSLFSKFETDQLYQVILIGSGVGQNIKTINGQSLLGAGDIVISVDLSGYLPLTGGTLDGDLTVVGNIYAPTIFQGGAMVLTVDDIDFTVMPYSANLSAIAALPGTSGLLRKTAANTWSLDTATYYTSSQVDALVQGLDPKASVRVATTANITLSGTQTVDGVALNIGDRVLAKNQTTQSQNGIRVVAAGAWPRAADMDVWTEVPGAYVFVEEGTINADTGWVCTSNAGGTIDSTAIVFGQFAGAGTVTAGSGITVNGNQVSIDSSVVTLTGNQTLTNKTLTSPTLTTPNIGAATGTSLTLSGTTTGVRSSNNPASTASATTNSAVMLTQLRDGVEQSVRAYRGRWIFDVTAGGPIITLADPGGPESSGFFGDGLGRPIGNGNAGLWASHSCRFWVSASVVGTSNALIGWNTNVTAWLDTYFKKNAVGDVQLCQNPSNTGEIAASLSVGNFKATGYTQFAPITKTSLLALTPNASTQGIWRVTDSTPKANRLARPTGTEWVWCDDETTVT